MLRWGIAAACLVAATAGSVNAAIEFNDPLANQQVYHDQLRFGEAWETIVGQPRRGQVTVAVLDSGFQIDHPDLKVNLVAGINIVDSSLNISPVHPHGTGTSGIPGAGSGNLTGISQTALTANVMPIRITNRPDGAAYINDMARAIRYAADNGARVINISYGGVSNKTIAKAARYAYRRGALTFMAAGNSGTRTKWRNYRHLIAVGSIDQNNVLSEFSTHGRFVDFVAPGEAVTTLYTEDGYEAWSGTSFSSPIAASVGALILTANPELSPSQVLRIMKKTAIDLGKKRRDKEYGYGLPDAEAAVELALLTKGRYRRRYKRMGFDPYVDNVWGDFSGLTDESVLELTSGLSSALALPQGFLDTASIATRPVPEPGTFILMLLGAALLLGRMHRPRCAQAYVVVRRQRRQDLSRHDRSY